MIPPSSAWSTSEFAGLLSGEWEAEAASQELPAWLPGSLANWRLLSPAITITLCNPEKGPSESCKFQELCALSLLLPGSLSSLSHVSTLPSWLLCFLCTLCPVFLLARVMLDQGSIRWLLLNVTTFKTLLCTYGHFLRRWGLGLSAHEFGKEHKWSNITVLCF